MKAKFAALFATLATAATPALAKQSCTCVAPPDTACRATISALQGTVFASSSSGHTVAAAGASVGCGGEFMTGTGASATVIAGSHCTVFAGSETSVSVNRLPETGTICLQVGALSASSTQALTAAGVAAAIASSPAAIVGVAVGVTAAGVAGVAAVNAVRDISD